MWSPVLGEPHKANSRVVRQGVVGGFVHSCCSGRQWGRVVSCMECAVVPIRYVRLQCSGFRSGWHLSPAACCSFCSQVPDISHNSAWLHLVACVERSGTGLSWHTMSLSRQIDQQRSIAVYRNIQYVRPRRTDHTWLGLTLQRAAASVHVQGRPRGPCSVPFSVRLQNSRKSLLSSDFNRIRAALLGAWRFASRMVPIARPIRMPI